MHNPITVTLPEINRPNKQQTYVKTLVKASNPANGTGPLTLQYIQDWFTEVKFGKRFERYAALLYLPDGQHVYCLKYDPEANIISTFHNDDGSETKWFFYKQAYYTLDILLTLDCANNASLYNFKEKKSKK